VTIAYIPVNKSKLLLGFGRIIISFANAKRATNQKMGRIPKNRATIPAGEKAYV
jgi:hypothetical protein